MDVEFALNEWQCQKCTYKNVSNVQKCDMCECEGNEAISNTNGKRSEEFQNSELLKLQQTFENYLELVQFNDTDLITCLDHFECKICLETGDPGNGVTLKNCLHTFCRECLARAVECSTNAEIQCPYSNDDYSCEILLEEREIRALVNADIYDKYLARSVSEAERKIQNSFHCQTANCPGWCIISDDVDIFLCPVCQKTNCLKCQAIHQNLTCVEYQVTVNVSESDEKSRSHLQAMLKKKLAMNCPTCQIIITKSEGCDWMVCSVCKTEICWATRGPRWGPKGRGDTSGGCKCKVGGKICAPHCGNCH